jgi:Ricin-type beta-trefoil lectin domain/Putative Ig domain
MFMRRPSRSIKASRNRILAIGASLLVSGSALAAAAMPAQAAPQPAVANTITVAAIAAHTTNPLSTTTVIPVKATETNQLGLLTFSVKGLPATATWSITQPTLPGDATVDLTVTFAAPFKQDVTVTATDDLLPTHHGSATFLWTADNTIKVANPGAQTTWLGLRVNLQTTATDSAPGESAHLTWAATDLPAGLSIGKTTGLISGRATKAAALTTIVTATDAYGATGSTTIAWNINDSVTIVNQGPQTTTVGRWKDIGPFKVTDHVPGDKPSFSATGLPPGMGFQPSPMLLYGWPTTAGTYSATVHEKGSLGTIDAMTFRLTVKPAPNKGSTGQIHLALDGKCLLDPGNRTASGTHVQIGNCVSGATQRWTVVADGTIRVNGRCLDIAGSGSAAGKQLQLTSCGNANPRQLWSQGTDGELINPASGLCLTDPGSSRKNGAVPTMGACHVRSYEQWTLPAQPILTALGGSCTDDHFSEGNNGAVIDMFWCNATPGQTWSLRPDGTIRAGLFGSKCLTVRSKKTVIYGCSGGDKTQKWTVVRTGAMSSELTEGGVCLAIPSLTSAKGTLLEPNGTQLITAKCSKTDPRDLWHIA